MRTWITVHDSKDAGVVTVRIDRGAAFFRALHALGINYRRDRGWPPPRPARGTSDTERGGVAPKYRHPKNRIWPVPVWLRIRHFQWDDPGSTVHRRSPDR